MNTELQHTKESLPVKIAEYSKTALALLDLGARYADVIFDVSQKQGMQAAKSARAEIRLYRVELEKTRVAIKAEALERGRLIDAEAKQIKAALEALEIPIDQQIKAEEKRKEDERIAAEKAEIERISNLQKAVSSLRNLPGNVSGRSSSEIKTALEKLKNLEITADLYAEYLDHAQAAKTEALDKLEKMATDAEALEKERAELARLRAEAEQRQREEAARKAEQAKLDQQRRDREEAELKAERERLAKERAEHEAKIREQEQREAEKRKAEEA